MQDIDMINKQKLYCYKIIHGNLYALSRQGKLYTAQNSLKSLIEIYDFCCYNLACMTCYSEYLVVIGVDGSVYYYSISENKLKYMLELNNIVVTPPIVTDTFMIVQTMDRLVSIQNKEIIASNENIKQHANMKGINSYNGHIISYHENSVIFLNPQGLNIIKEMSMVSTYIWSKVAENDSLIAYHTYKKFIVIEKSTDKILYSNICINKRNFPSEPLILKNYIIYFDNEDLVIIYLDDNYKVKKCKVGKTFSSIYYTDEKFFYIKKNKLICVDLKNCKKYKLFPDAYKYF